MTLSSTKKSKERVISTSVSTHKNPIPYDDSEQRLHVKKLCQTDIGRRTLDVTNVKKETSCTPPRGCEVFVSRIPKTTTESELLDLFEDVGKVYEIRLMMETKDLNKGFAFVRYCSRSDADTSVDKLNNYEIKNGVKLSVTKSVDNNRIFIGNVPRTFTQDDIWESMINLAPGIAKIILYPDINDRNRNRGYGFVEFESHHQAATARQKLISEPLVWFGQEIKVDWAEPLLEVDEETMSRVKILYVRNLSLTTTEQQLLDLFSSLGGQIDRVRKLKDYAFVHFATREQAEHAKTHFQGHMLDGCEMDISWSKPVTNREEYQQRKAMSKLMLSKANTSTSPALAAISVQGEPIFLNPKVRNAAGSQGYASPKTFIGQKRSDQTYIPKVVPQPNLLVPAQYYPTISPTVKNSVEQFGLTPSLQQIYPLERAASSEDIPTLEDGVQMHLAAPLYGSPTAAAPQWAQMPVVMPQQLMYSYNNLPQITGHPNIQAPTSYYYQQPTIPQAMVNNSHFNPFPYTQFIQSPMMTHITNISTSTMGVDRQ